MKNQPINQETQVQSLGQENPLEEKMASHFRTLAWEIPWTEEPGGLQSTRVTKSWTRLSDFHFSAVICPLVQFYEQVEGDER